MTILFALHSAYGLATAAAAIDEGMFDGRVDRVLTAFNSARVPETTVGIDELSQLKTLRARFDRAESLDALLQPRHPSSWAPRDEELPILRRLLERAWNLDDDLELCVQSPQVAPARTLMSLFPNARITIIGDGLMTYAPLRVTLPRGVVERVTRVIYADVVPGVEPLAFHGTAARMPVPPAAFRNALLETSADDAQLDAVADGTPTVLVLGQYLAALGLVTPEEEIAMQCDMVDRAAAWRPGRIIFKPHPAAPPLVTGAVRERAERHGAHFVEYRGAQPAELVAERVDAAGVVAGFSTALPTVQALFGRPIASTGTHTVLRQLVPFENSNRVPATIVDALTRVDSPFTEPEQLQHLIDGVGYAMQPRIASPLRPRAEELLRRLTPEERDRYFDAERLARLRLPGAPPESLPRHLLRSRGGVGPAEELRLSLQGARRRAGRVWKAARGL